jgi:hypothetical protein
MLFSQQYVSNKQMNMDYTFQDFLPPYSINILLRTFFSNSFTFCSFQELWNYKETKQILKTQPNIWSP